MAGAVLYPFKVSSLAWEPRPGKWNLTISLKATFALASAEELLLAPQQDGIHDDVHFDDTPLASVYSPSDYVPFKPRVDVLLVGHAHAPGGVAVHNLMVRLCVGDFAKALRVCGDRSWVDTPRGPRASQPRAFTRMPLRYERAARKGENVVGAARGDAKSLPPNIDVAAEDGPEETPGFGPIAPSWRAVSDPGVNEAKRWVSRLRTSHRAGAIPFGMSIDVFNIAPRDQQLTELEPGTPLVLENLHPRLPRLGTQVPSVVPKVFHVDPGKGEPSEVAVRLDTLWIDTDHEVLVVTWRGVTSIAAPEALGVGKVFVAAHPPGATVSFQDVETLFQRASSARAPAPARLAPATVRIERVPDKTGPFPKTPPVQPRPAAPVPTMPLPVAMLFRDETPSAGVPLEVQARPHPSAPPPKRVPPTLDLDGMQPLEPAVAPFPLASPGSTTSAEPPAGAPWATERAAPVPMPGTDFEETLRVGPSLVALIQPVAASTAPKRLPPTLDLEGQRPIVPDAAPFPLAGPGTTVSAAPPAGAPWADESAEPAPSPSQDQRETLPMGRVFAQIVSNAGPAEVVLAPRLDPPSKVESPLIETAPQTLAVAEPRAAPEVAWRVDTPEPSPPAAARPTRPAAPPPDPKSVVYGGFTRPRR